MSNVSMELVKKLRDQTQVGMMDCKKALEDANGDMEKAVEILRKKGAAVAAKRADNVTNQGRVEAFINSDSTTGAIIEMACETDFSANTDSMKQFVLDVAENLVESSATDIEALMGQQLRKKNLSVRQYLDELVAKICENIKINRMARFQATMGLVNVYIHPGSSIGVMVELATDKNIDGAQREDLKTAARDVCMQIAVTNPLCTQPSELDPAILQKERELAREQLKGSGKPDNVIEKIIEGKLGKFYQDACLLNQPFIKNDKLTIQSHLDEVGKKLGTKITVKQFKRFAIGR